MTGSRIPDLETVASPPRRELDYFDLEIGAEPLGRGGQTVVYEARVPDAEPPETVAVRQLGDRGFRKSVEWGNDGELEPFFEQAETWASLARRERTEPRWSDSDHIVGVVALGENLPWAALEYMDGGSLVERLDGTDGLPIEEAAWIGERLCRGLQVAHNTGVAHLDLKPGNILFRKTGGDTWDVPKIADWGLARNLLDDTSDSLEVLSIEYAAPEQFAREEFGRPGTATDIYQLGAVVYALLTGDPPYTGTDRNVMFDIVTEELPPPPSQRRGEISRELDAVVQTALEPRKSDRYGGIDTFERALRAVRSEDRLPSVVEKRVAAGGTSGGKGTDTGTPGDRVGPTESGPVTQWPMYGFGPARRGVPSSHTGPDEPVTTRWQFDTSGTVRSSPAVADGTVYVGSDDGYLYAVDAATGKARWRFEISGSLRSSPAVADGTVYIGCIPESVVENYGFIRTLLESDDRGLYAVEAATGTKQWQFDIPHPVVSSPAVAGGIVYIGAGSNLYAVNSATGEQRWQFDTSGFIRSSPVVADGTVYVGSTDENLYAADAATGEQQWQFHTTGAVVSSPAVADGTVYVGSNDHSLYAVDAAAGTKQWQFDTSGHVESSPAVVGSTVYFGSDNNRLHAVESAD